MISKYLSFLFILAYHTSILGQQVKEGNFNDWDFGPHTVTGNYSVSKTSGRKYYQIKQHGRGRVTVSRVNPSGIITKTTTLTYKNGIITEIRETDRWGELSDLTLFSQTGDGIFKVTELSEGKNTFLPCKYVSYTYTGELLSEIRYYSFTDELTENSNGIAIVRYVRYDDPIRFAATKEVAFFDAKDEPVKNKSSGYHRVKNVFDERCDKINESYFGVDNEPIGIMGSAICQERFTYNEDQNRIKEEHLGLDGAIAENLSGIASIVFNYAKGYKIRETRFNRLGVTSRSAASSDSVSIIQFHYDAKGNLLQEAYFDKDLHPISNVNGLHAVNFVYSPAGMLVEKTFADNFDRPSVNADGIHRFSYGLDKTGRLIQLAAYDAENKPLHNSADQVFMTKYRYDQSGRIITRSYWKDSLTKMTRWSGEFEQRTEYNEDGQPVAYIFFDASGKLFTSEDGSSTVRLQYIKGKLAERRYLNQDSLIMRSQGMTNGYSIIKYGYNRYGLINELTFFDHHEQPVNATVSIDNGMPDFKAHKITFGYKGSRIIEQAYYEVGQTEPFNTVNTLKTNYVAVTGVQMARKNAY